LCSDDLFDRGLFFDARVFAGMRHWFLRAMPGVTASTTTTTTTNKESEDNIAPPTNGLDAVRTMFRWRDSLREAEETRVTGVGLLFWSAIVGNVEAIQELAAANTADEEAAATTPSGSPTTDVLRIHRPELFSTFTKGVTPVRRKILTYIVLVRPNYTCSRSTTYKDGLIFLLFGGESCR
jgi:hypothetical protein